INSDRDRATWHRIEELLKLRANLMTHAAEFEGYLQTVKIEEVESILYEALVPQVRAVMRSFTDVSWPTEVQKEIVNEAIDRIMRAYATFRRDSSLRTYCTRIIKNVALGYLKKQRRERDRVPVDEDEVTRDLDQQAFEQYRKENNRAESEAIPEWT